MTLDTGHVLGGFWYAVRAYPRDANGMLLPPVDGWMHSTVIHLEADQLAALSARTGMAGMATATAGAGVSHPLAQAPTAPPPTATPGPTTAPPIAVPLSWRICYDLHANKACDPDEGVTGVLVYATDPATGRILSQVQTDDRGVASFTWGVGADTVTTAEVSLSAPLFQQVRQVRAARPATKPVIIATLAPLPALIP
jgi:hypothetical protein